MSQLQTRNIGCVDSDNEIESDANHELHGFADGSGCTSRQSSVIHLAVLLSLMILADVPQDFETWLL